MPSRWNLPSMRLSPRHRRARPGRRAPRPRSGCPPRSRRSRFLRVGIVVLRSISVVITPPRVSMPSDSGVTSSSSMSLTSPAQHAALDRGADRHHLVRVDALVRLLAEEVLDQLLDRRDAGRAADQHDLVDVLGVEPASFSAFLLGAIERWTRSSISCSSFGRVSLTFMCFGPDGVGRDERQVDLGLLAAATARSSPSRRPPSDAGSPSCPCRGRSPGPS